MNSPITQAQQQTLQQADQTVALLLKDLRAKREALWEKLPPFDLEKAVAGHPYVHRFDLPTRVCYADVRKIAEPHGGYMIWAGDWLIWDEVIDEYLRMADPAVLGMLEVSR